MSNGIEKPNSLPKGWSWTTVGEISQNIQYGYTASATSEPCGAKFLRITDIQENSVDWDSVPYCQIDEAGKSKFLLQQGDLVFARTGATVGKSFLIRGNLPESVFASYLIRICLDQSVNESFVASFFHSHLYWSQIQKGKAGIGQPNVNATKLSQIAIPLPPLPEQHRIVSKIEELFTKLDAGVEELKKAKARLRRYSQAVLQAAVIGELTRQWRDKNIDKTELADELLSRILDAHRNEWEHRERARLREGGQRPKNSNWKDKYRPPKEVNIHELPELPIGWVWATAEQLAAAENHSMTDGPFGSNLKTEHYTSEGARVIRLQNIGSCEFIDEKAHISQDHFQKLKKHAVHGGDIVIRSLGFPSPTACTIPDWVGDAIVKADCFRYKVAERFVNPTYVMYALNSPSTQKRTEALVHGVGRPRLNLNEVKSIPLPLPPLHEQIAIVDEVESRLSIMDEVSSVIDMNLKRIETLRQTILRRAFEGRLVVQNPSDEPAEKLLERIRQSASKCIQTKRKRKSNGETPNGE